MQGGDEDDVEVERGVDIDPQAALFHYKAAARHGCKLAMLALSNLCADLPRTDLSDVPCPDPPDLKRSLLYARLAAERGSRLGTVRAAAYYAPDSDSCIAPSATDAVAMLRLATQATADADSGGSFDADVSMADVWARLGELLARDRVCRLVSARR